jgi:hypothetical protein
VSEEKSRLFLVDTLNDLHAIEQITAATAPVAIPCICALSAPFVSTSSHGSLLGADIVGFGFDEE